MRAKAWWRERREHATRSRAARPAPERPQRLLVETLESRLLLSADPLAGALADLAHVEPFPQGVVAWLQDLDRVEDGAREAAAALPTGAGRLQLPDAAFDRTPSSPAIATLRATHAGGDEHALRDAHRSEHAEDILTLRLQDTPESEPTDATATLLSLPAVAPGAEVSTSATSERGVVLVFDDGAPVPAGPAAAAAEADGAPAARADFALDEVAALIATRASGDATATTSIDMLSSLAAARPDASASIDFARSTAAVADSVSALVFGADADTIVGRSTSEHDALASWGVAHAAERIDSLFRFTDPFALIETT